jgi:hypothetical protein
MSQRQVPLHIPSQLRGDPCSGDSSTPGLAYSQHALRLAEASTYPLGSLHGILFLGPAVGWLLRLLLHLLLAILGPTLLVFLRLLACISTRCQCCYSCCWRILSRLHLHRACTNSTTSVHPSACWPVVLGGSLSARHGPSNHERKYIHRECPTRSLIVQVTITSQLPGWRPPHQRPGMRQTALRLR